MTRNHDTESEHIDQISNMRWNCEESKCIKDQSILYQRNTKRNKRLLSNDKNSV